MSGITRVGKYELAELLHRGSRYDVLGVEGRDDLVVKLRHPVHDEIEKATVDPEVTMTTFARSRAIVPIVDFGDTEERSFIVMERVRGAMTLADSLSRIGPLAPRAALPILYQFVRGVGDLHRAGIAHRSLRPENVMLGPNGAKPPRVYLLGLHGSLRERDPGSEADSPAARSAMRADFAAIAPIFAAVVAKESRPESFERIISSIRDFFDAEALLEHVTRSLLLDAPTT